ncbi:MAG: terpene cyclase/mutase family protein [Candidatus Liptonbacteria bacterium]|nr:terpene cyclase/mutase family protein [Candidatus Liptonbacteria bacterium]
MKISTKNFKLRGVCLISFAVFALFYSPVFADDSTSTSSSTDQTNNSTSTPILLDNTTSTATSTDPIDSTSTISDATTTVRSATFNIRNGASVIWSGEVAVPDSDTATTTVIATDGTSVEIKAASILAALVSADAAQPEFSISNLQYFASFSAFYVKCITATDEACDNWQYAVNGNVPGFGADSYLLAGGENIFFFYGYPRRVSLSSSTINVGSPVTATAEIYVPSSDSYNPTPGLTIGVVQQNPDNPFAPIEIATSTADKNGQAAFTLNATGTYQVGLQEDFYFPTTDLLVVEAHQIAPAVSAGGGGEGGVVVHHNVDVNKAQQFLFSHQLENGSFGPLLYTDWVAIALAGGSGGSIANLAEYLKSANSGMSAVTDYERHAMALMALGINPYSGASADYIQKIIDKFDGTQVGDAGLVNDDIFALFPLVRAGYSYGGDEIIQKINSFVLSKQLINGSWEDSVDLTAAAIQVLSQNTSGADVPGAISRARAYLAAHQNSDGGFGTSYSTSWAAQAITALREPELNWTKNYSTPYDYLYSLQAADGGIESTSTDLNSRIWATSYAIPAALNKTWWDLLHSFAKPAPATSPVVSVPGSSGGGSQNQNGTSSVAVSASTTIPTESSTSSAEIIENVVSSITATSTPQLESIVPKSNVAEIKSSPAQPAPKSDFAEEQADTRPILVLESSTQPDKREKSSLANIISFGYNLISFTANAFSSFVSKLVSIVLSVI